MAIGDRYCVALRAADGPAAEEAVEEALRTGLAPTTVQVGVIMAAMNRMGKLWEQGEITVADEHAATSLSYRAMLPLQEPLQVAPPRSRQRVVLAAVEGQAHVLGLRMIGDVLEGAGFEVVDLGADVPSLALRAFVAEHMPAVVGLSSTQARDAPHLAAAILAAHDGNPAARVMIGGQGVLLAWRDNPYPWVHDATGVLDAVERLLSEPPQEPPPMIAKMRSEATPPARTASKRALLGQRAAVDVMDSGEVARRYARRAAEYRYLAHRDSLTGLPNRRAFEDRMIALSERGQDSALLVVDVDEFKRINDTKGHDAGDALLVALGQAISGAVRSGDTVARVGGDEFAVLLPHCTKTEAKRVAEKIRTAALQASGGEATVCVGATLLGADRRRAALHADRALYAAKAAGRNRTRLARARSPSSGRPPPSPPSH